MLDDKDDFNDGRDGRCLNLSIEWFKREVEEFVDGPPTNYRYESLRAKLDFVICGLDRDLYWNRLIPLAALRKQCEVVDERFK